MSRLTALRPGTAELYENIAPPRPAINDLLYPYKKSIMLFMTEDFLKGFIDFLYYLESQVIHIIRFNTLCCIFY